MIFSVDTLQIYFPASLEIQEELINHGFKIPANESGKIKTPIPLIYANSRGWLKDEEPITIERLIPPEWLKKSPDDFGWTEIKKGNRKAYFIPPEDVIVEIECKDKIVYFMIKAKRYHLERTSIRQVGPEKWNNWSMFYISVEYINELLDELKQYDTLADFGLKVYTEKQQGGKEITLFASGKGKLGIPIVDYSFCLGCFDLALDYFRVKAVENGLNENVVNKLKLRLAYSKDIQAGLKVGVAKIEGKQPQIMFKLATSGVKTISGILKEKIEGKPRGKLIYCDHMDKIQYVAVRGDLLYKALKTVLDDKRAQKIINP